MDADFTAAISPVRSVATDQVMSLASESAELAQPLRTEFAHAHPSMAGVEDYLALLKPRVMSLVVFTGLVGMLVAPGHLHPVLGFTALLCIAIGAGAAGALNMWYDADIDAIMTRTAKRPIPAGRNRTLGSARHDRVDVGVVPHVERTCRARTDGDAQQRRKAQHRMQMAGRNQHADQPREHDERHHPRLEQREIIFHARHARLRVRKFRPQRLSKFGAFACERHHLIRGNTSYW